MRAYAYKTKVSTHRTVDQVERMLLSAGAQDVSTGSKRDLFAVSFSMGDRRYRFTVPLHFPAVIIPKPRRQPSEGQLEKLRAQLAREKYRALFATVKAKLVSVQAGIETFEDAFLAQAVTSTGETVAQWLLKSELQMDRPALMEGTA